MVFFKELAKNACNVQENNREKRGDIFHWRYGNHKIVIFDYHWAVVTTEIIQQSKSCTLSRSFVAVTFTFGLVE